MSWHTKTIAELSKSLHSKEVSSQELANYFLARISQSTELNAFVDVNVEQTLLQAKTADAQLADGSAGPLTGVPLAHKDIFVTKHWKTTAGSKILNIFISPFDAHVVAELGVGCAGMVCLGKVNMDEFAMGS